MKTSDEAKKLDIQKSSVVFALDMHKVLIKPDIKAMFKMLLVRKYVFLIFFDLRIWYHIIKDGSISEKVVDILDKKYRDKGVHKEFLIKVLNCQHLNISTIEVFQRLKDRGYNVYLTSNIWQELFQDLMQKFPIFKSLFNGYYIPSKENNYVKKPDKRYYEGFKIYLAQKGNGNKKIIFVDNDIRNIKAAKHTGFITIMYTGTKALIKDLHRLGFMFNKS